MSEERTVSIPVLVVLAALALGVVIAVFVVVRRAISPPASPRLVLSEEEKAYLRHIVVTDPRMSAAENFLGDTITYLDARVSNQGTRPVRRIDLQLEFVDTLNQVVLRETAQPITPRAAPLKPGETRSFRVTFEHMPLDWNQAPPAITPSLVNF